MKLSSTRGGVGVAAAVAVLVACSVPHAALDTAALGSQTALKTSQQLQNLEQAQQAAAARREQRLAFLRQQLAKTNAVEQEHIDVSQVAGANASLKLSASIAALAASQAQAAQKVQGADAPARVASDMLAPIGKAVAALSILSADLAPLSKQRTSQERLEIAMSFAKSVRQQADAASAAQGAAASAAAAGANALTH